MTRYGTVAILLHWTIAALVIANIVLGLRMGGAVGLTQFALFQLHKSIGITVLVLSVARIAWRLSHRPPALASTLTDVEQRAARAVHAGFYVWMIALPVTGWIMVSASRLNIPTLLYGKLPWPHIAPVHAASAAERVRIESVAGTTHEVLAYAMIALVALHVAGALKHHFVDRDGTLARMLPFASRKAI